MWVDGDFDLWRNLYRGLRKDKEEEATVLRKKTSINKESGQEKDSESSPLSVSREMDQNVIKKALILSFIHIQILPKWKISIKFLILFTVRFILFFWSKGGFKLFYTFIVL